MLLPLGPDMVHGVLLRRAPAHCRPPAGTHDYNISGVRITRKDASDNQNSTDIRLQYGRLCLIKFALV